MAVIGNLIANLRLNSATFQRDIKKAQRSLTNVGSAMSRLGTDLTRSVTLPLVAAGFAVVKFGSDFESAFAGVKKTVEGTPEQLQAISDGLRSMSKELPVAVEELAQIAENAGQLGIQTPKILEFTRVMAELGVTTNLSASEAAIAIARMVNIMGTSQNKVSNLSSALVALGNKFATTEAEILDMALQLSGAGKQIGLTEAEVLGFAAALSAVGIKAERGGSAFSRVFSDIEKAVVKGSKNLELFAEVAGVSSAQFAKSFKKNAAGAIQSFLEGLKNASDQGASMTIILEALGLGGIRVADSLKRTGSNALNVGKSLKVSAKAFEENTARAKEAEERFKTFASQVSVIGNRLKDIGIDLFQALRPILVETVLPAIRLVVIGLTALARAFSEQPRFVQAATLALLTLAAAAGPVIGFVSALVFSVKNIVVLFGAAGPALAKLGPFLTGIAGRFAAIRVGIAAATASLAGGGGMLAVLGKVAAFLTGPFGLALIAVSALVVVFKDEIADAIVGLLEFFGIVEDRSKQATDLMSENFGFMVKKITENLGVLPDIGLKALDKMTKGSKEWSAALAENNAKVKKFLEGLNKNRDAFVKLKEQFQSGALSASEYAVKLKALASGSTEAAKGTAAVGEEAKKTTGHVIDMSKFMGAAAGSMDTLASSTRTALNPMAELVAEIDKLTAASFSAEEIALALAGRMQEAAEAEKEMAEQARFLGIEIDAIPLSEAAQKVKEYSLELKKLARIKAIAAMEADKLADAVRDGTAFVEAAIDSTSVLGSVTERWSKSTNEAVQRLRDLAKTTRENVATIKQMIAAGFTVNEIVLATGVSATTLRRRMKSLGIEIDETTGAFLRQVEASEESIRASKQLEDAWTQAMGNILSRFTDSVTGMLFEGRKFSLNLKDIFKDLAKSIVQILLGQLLKPVFGFFNNLGDILSKGLGGGGFDFGGLFSGTGFGQDGGSGGQQAAGGIGGVGGIGALGGKIGGLFASIGKAIGGGVSAVAGLGPLLAVPIFGAIAAGIAALIFGFGGRDLGSVAKDLQRDFNLAFNTDQLKKFTETAGISKETFKKFTKSISLSPAFFKFAQSMGVSNEQLIAAFSSVEVLGRRLDLSAEAAAAAAGDFSLLNAKFKELFGASNELKEALGGSLDPLLDQSSEASSSVDEVTDSVKDLADEVKGIAVSVQTAVASMTEAVSGLTDTLAAGFEDLISRLDALLEVLGDRIEGLTNNLAALTEGALGMDAALPAGVSGDSAPGGAFGSSRMFVQSTSLSFVIKSPSEDLARVTKEVVIPAISRELNLGSTTLRSDVVRAVERNRQGVTFGNG